MAIDAIQSLDLMAAAVQIARSLKRTWVPNRPSEKTLLAARELDIEIVHDQSRLLALRDEWNALASRFKTPLLEHDWLTACAAAFCPPYRLRILVFRDGSEVVAVAPFVMTRRWGAERLELLGASILQEQCGFLYRDAESHRQLLKEVCSLGLPMVLSKLPSDSLENCLLKEYSETRQTVVYRKKSGSPWILIDKTWEEFEAGMSSSRRSSLRRARRRLEQSGDVDIQISSPTEQTVASYLDVLFAVEAEGWKGRMGTAILNLSGLQEFLSTYAQISARAGTLRFGVVRVGGEAIASMMAVERANRFWVLKTGYNEAWAHGSPGILLMHEAIRWAFDRGLSAFEFLGTDEPWIHMWTDQKHPYETHRFYPPTWRGLIWLAVDAQQKIWNRTLTMKSRIHVPGFLRKIRNRTIERIAKRHVAGAELSDAVRMCRRQAPEGNAFTIGAWSGHEPAADVLNVYKRVITEISSGALDARLAAKVSDLRFDAGLVRDLASFAASHRVAIQFDSLDPASAQRTLSLIETARDVWADVGCTIPSRWRRSIDDAEWAIALGIRVRVVKGMWSDPDAPGVDARKEFLAIVQALSGRCVHVSVATHDRRLAREALLRLKESGTPSELEQMFGLPLLIRTVGKPLGIPVRLYVPFGHPYLPYNVGHVVERPGMAFWVIRDLLQRSTAVMKTEMR